MENTVKLLSLENLGDFDDGLLREAFAVNLKLIVGDLNERPNDDRTRKLKIEFSFTPQAIGGDLDRVQVEYKVTHNIAGHEGRECILTPKIMDKKMHLVFASTGTDSRQPHLPFDGE